MNCKRNPMRKYELDMFKSVEQRTKEELERIKIEEELKRRAKIRVEKRISPEEMGPDRETKKPTEYASVKDIVNQITRANKVKKEELPDFRLKDENFISYRVKEDEKEKKKEEKVKYPKMELKEIKTETNKEIEFMLSEIAKTKNIRIIKAIKKKAEEKGYAEVIIAAQEKINALSEEGKK
ncbi:MAG: hypothetical protein ACTSPI_14190 [Candidatus Heimdallarchaeaceae archaeon]